MCQGQGDGCEDLASVIPEVRGNTSNHVSFMLVRPKHHGNVGIRNKSKALKGPSWTLHRCWELLGAEGSAAYCHDAVFRFVLINLRYALGQTENLSRYLPYIIGITGIQLLPACEPTSSKT